MMLRSLKSTVLLPSLIFFAVAALASDVYFVGHSLVNHEMPHSLDQIATSLQTPHSSKEAIINGSPLRYHWNNPSYAEGDANVTVDLPTGQYDTLVLTESVPLHSTFRWNNPVHYASQFIGLATPARPNLRVMLYETWPHINNVSPRNWQETTWEAEIEADLARLEAAADELELLNNLQGPVNIVPAGLALRRLKMEVAAGTVPGLNNFTDLFADQIHLRPEGNYFVALVFYATLYGTSPEGATSTIRNRWGWLSVDIPPARALRYQEIAWDVVSTYERSGSEPSEPDSDRDGVPDAEDACPNSITGALSFAGCSPQVPNLVSDGGCTLGDLLDNCQATSSNRTELVACVYNATADFVAQGLLTSQQQNALLDCAQTYGLPHPTDDHYTITTSQVLQVPAPGVLMNDEDDEGDPLSSMLDEAPNSGSLVLNGNGSLEFQPDPGMTGSVSFSYRCDDGDGYRVAWVTIDIFPEGGDADGDGVPDGQDQCEATRATPTLMINGCDSGVPNLDFGQGCFLSDEIDEIAQRNYPRWRFVQTVQGLLGHYRNQGLITSAELNAIRHCAQQYDLPTAVADTYTMSANSQLQVASPGLLANDFDLEGDPMETHIHSWPSVGYLSLPRDGSFRYVPPQGFQGEVTFVYRSWDGSGYRTAPVTIYVNP